MPPKLRHECERCGLVAELERTGRFRDEDFYGVFHELMELQAAHQHTLALLAQARQRVERLRTIVQTEPATEDNPFP